MKSVTGYMLMIFSYVFWIFRIIVVLTSQVGGEFVVQPANAEIEIITLFLTLPILLWLGKSKMIPAILYLGMYSIYFGQDLFNNVMMYQNGEAGISDVGVAIFISAIAMLLAILQFISTCITISKKGNEKDKKTDWFYKNKDYDRKLDERADKNNYRIL